MGTTARRPTRSHVTAPRPIAPLRPRNIRYPAPAPGRLRPYRAKSRGGIPWIVRLFLALALLALGGASVLAAAGLLSGVLSNIGATVAAIFSAQLAPLVQSPTPPASPDAPRLVLTGAGCTDKECWTNQNEWTVRGFVPLTLTDQGNESVRVYISGEQAAEQPLTGTQDFSVTVKIPQGPSKITATIVGPSGESPESNPIVVVFDNKAPPIKISSPKDGANVKSDSVTVRGTTQAGSTVSIKNETNGGRASAVATDGTFAIQIILTSGSNVLAVTAVDPAGNSKTVTLKVTGSTGSATASLSITPTSFSTKGGAISMSVRVLGPAGKPINGARAVFTIQAPGIGPIQSPEILTVNGIASFNTQIPKGAQKGAGLVTVSVTTDSYGTLSDTAAFRIS